MNGGIFAKLVWSSFVDITEQKKFWRLANTSAAPLSLHDSQKLRILRFVTFRQRLSRTLQLIFETIWLNIIGSTAVFSIDA